MDTTDNVKLTQTSIITIAVLLTITLGLYYPIWFLQRRAQFNALQSKLKLSATPFMVSIVIGVLSLALSFSGRYFKGLSVTQPDLANLGKILTYTSWGVLLVYLNVLLLQCFKVKLILEHHFNDHLQRQVTFSAVGTFFLTIYYLQYKINRLI
jgi:hypothetical protein